jgi:tetratricopeptide (TPR) repeat protein
MRRLRPRLRFATIAVALGLTALAALPSSDASAKDKDSKEEEADDIDYVALAARLIKDGHFDRAEIVLKEVDLKKPGVDASRFHTLVGLVQLKKGAAADARKSFQKAITAGQKEKVIYLYLAQASFALKDYKGTIAALRKAGKEGRDVPGTYYMRSQAHWELGQRGQALTALDEGQKAFPKQTEFTRIKLFYLIDLGLFQEVARVGEKFLSRPDVTADDYAAVGEGLRQSKQLEHARDVLEAAHLRFPEDEKLLVLLAHTYLDDGHPLIAAMLFEDAARLEPKYALEAAELYLKAGRLERALANNSRVGDQKAKMKQRLSVLLKMDRFNMIIGMEPRLSRLGLLSDENIRYALAYSYFKVSEFDKAEGHLKQLTDARLFESAMQLRKAMATCREAGWECI